MTISTFADLKSQVATYLNRSNLTTQIPIFVQLAEARIWYGSKEAPFQSEPLRIRAMEQSSFATFNSQSIALPSDFLASRRLYISNFGEIKFLPPDQFWQKWLSATSGQPMAYTVEGENLVLGPTPDSSSTYTGRLLYYKKFTALSGDTDTNWILTNAPAVYLHGTLLEAFRYARNSVKAAEEANVFSGLINGLNDADKADRYASPWTAVSDTGNP